MTEITRRLNNINSSLCSLLVVTIIFIVAIPRLHLKIAMYTLYLHDRHRSNVTPMYFNVSPLSIICPTRNMLGRFTLRCSPCRKVIIFFLNQKFPSTKLKQHGFMKVIAANGMVTSALNNYCNLVCSKLVCSINICRQVATNCVVTFTRTKKVTTKEN